MLPRISMAIGGALALHLAVVSTAHMAPRTAKLAWTAEAMTVRYIGPAVARPMIGQTAQGNIAVPAQAPAPAMLEGSIDPPRKSQADPDRGGTPFERLPPAPAKVEAPFVTNKTATTSAQPTFALPLAPDYFLGAMLDTSPQPIGEIEPEYPDSAHLQEGTVILRILISDAGRVDDVAVVKSDPEGLFEDAALEAFGKAQFTPGRSAGVPVKSQITVEVHFIPINRGARISGRTY